jgi:alcohol dehydrogenase class IV
MTQNQFDFSTANRIRFGPGSLNELPEMIKNYGRKIAIVRPSHQSAFLQMEKLIDKNIFQYDSIFVDAEPNLQGVMAAIDQAIRNRYDFVIGIGGGSVMDTAKVIATMLTNAGDLMDYLEVVGKGLPLKNRCAPLIAIPTTSGTGSEVTRNAVIDIPGKNLKVSMRSPLMLPWISIVDPLLTLSVPPDVTAYTGMDAFIQVIEPYVCVKANYMTDRFCEDGIKRAANNLLQVYRNGSDQEARCEMSLVSLFGGLSLANAGVGAIHAFASVIGSTYHVPHGAACACFLPSVVQVNIAALQERNPGSISIKKYANIVRWITKNEKATFEDGIEWFNTLCHSLNIPRLRDYQIKKTDFNDILQVAKKTSSMKANPIDLLDEELMNMLVLAY